MTPALRWPRIGVPLLLSLAAACASEDQRRHSFDQGWVDVRVTQTHEPLRATPAPEDDCRQTDAGAGFRYAEVAFWWRGFSRRRIARLPIDGVELHEGDFAYANLRDCGIPLVPSDKRMRQPSAPA
jgi:hypothetical protein